MFIRIRQLFYCLTAKGIQKISKRSAVTLSQILPVLDKIVPKKLFNDKKVQICSCLQCPSVFSNLMSVVYVNSQAAGFCRI